MIVVDASAMIEVLLVTPAVLGLEERLFTAKSTLHVPHLLDLEVAQVLRRYVARQEIEALRASQALADLTDLPLTRYPHEPFLPRIWELQQNVTAYDAAYLALAEELRVPLLTCDGRLARSAGHEAVIEVL